MPTVAFDDAEVTVEEAVAQLRPAWMADANCRGMGSALFFPGQHDRDDSWRQVCAGCTVHEQCLAEAMSSGDVHGNWAGTTTKQRHQMRRDARGAA